MQNKPGFSESEWFSPKDSACDVKQIYFFDGKKNHQLTVIYPHEMQKQPPPSIEDNR